MTLKMSRLSRGAAALLLAATTAGTTVVVAPAATAESVAPLSTETEETTDSAPECKDANTISVLAAFDQMAAETKAGIPAQFGSMFDTNVNNLRASLISTDVAYIDVSRDASEINSVAEENEDPYANFAVARLDKIRNGQEDAVVAFQDLSLSEVVETLVLGMYTFTVPLDVVAQAMPSIMPIPGTEAVAGTPLIGGYLTVGFLAKLPFQLGSKGIKALANALQDNLTSRCWEGEDAPSDEERLSSGGANPVIPVQDAERGNAAYMSLDDAETCVPASAETLGAALDRVDQDMRPQIPADKLDAYDAEVARLRANAQTARVANNFIMKDEEDLNPILVMIDNPLVTFTWGAIEGAFDGTSNQTTAVADLTVGNGVDYATVADALAGLIIGQIWDSATASTEQNYDVGSLFDLGGTQSAKGYSVLPNLTNVAFYFTGTALEVYDHVIDTMCLAGTEGTVTPEE
ncbi:hypothetical protein [Corynebacterium terpenotabidum]|uniref:Secreted protein n=1 Tax=Corynebacterium terpenotabidum Y-11 TaxID=1200352 RepID=S4XGA8_9CORY|nr:hypothetical protein [Corynebacterium terpenotabidum]AGP29693.1 hypothetical protein A606_00175 [Corynebacterium terpenotabidum Y-11]